VRKGIVILSGYEKETLAEMAAALVNANRVNKLGVVVLPDFSFGPLFSSLYPSLIAKFRSRAALQLEILALRPSTRGSTPLRQTS
jgi:hypothetical protein